MTKVTNLSTGVEQYFDEHMSPVSAVAYAYCEENHLLSKLFSTMNDEQARTAFLATLPFTQGKLSLACGDWSTLLVHDKRAQRTILRGMRHPLAKAQDELAQLAAVAQQAIAVPFQGCL